MSTIDSRLLDRVVTAEAYLELQERLDDLSAQLDELRQRDHVLSLSLNQLDQQMRLASQVQRDLLPRPLPQVRGARIHTLFRPADHVSGDIYNVVRLDETSVALSVADATGHGIAAALLTVFIKQALRGKETFNGSYRLVPPAEVLARLNADLLDTDLSDGQFVTAVYAVYDERERRLTWSRAGAPYPILIRRGERPRLLRSGGPLLGAVASAKFETQTIGVEAGDTLLFHTDGVDALLTDGTPRRGAADVQDTEWFASLGRRPIAESLAEIGARLDSAVAEARPVDDVTVVALSVE